jgi:DNA repair exonuclease SbcCD ATPase subunit
VSQFENSSLDRIGTNAHDIVASLRGEMLERANTRVDILCPLYYYCLLCNDILRSQIRNLESEASRANSFHTESTAKLRQELLHVTCDKEALMEEVHQLSQLLAQRTVLYAAQERRYLNAEKSADAYQRTANHSLTEAHARLSVMEEHIRNVDSERVEALLLNKQLSATVESLGAQLNEELEKSGRIEKELVEAVNQNSQLAQSLDRLRNSDVQDLELEMSRELENIRYLSKNLENELRLQLEEARELLSNERAQVEMLMVDNDSLRQQIQSLLSRNYAEEYKSPILANIDSLHSSVSSASDNLDNVNMNESNADPIFFLTEETEASEVDNERNNSIYSYRSPTHLIAGIHDFASPSRGSSPSKSNRSSPSKTSKWCLTALSDSEDDCEDSDYVLQQQVSHHQGIEEPYQRQNDCESKSSAMHEGEVYSYRFVLDKHSATLLKELIQLLSTSTTVCGTDNLILSQGILQSLQYFVMGLNPNNSHYSDTVQLCGDLPLTEEEYKSLAKFTDSIKDFLYSSINATIVMPRESDSGVAETFLMGLNAQNDPLRAHTDLLPSRITDTKIGGKEISDASFVLTHDKGIIRDANIAYETQINELRAERDGLLTRVQVNDETSSTIDDLRAERDRLLAELENVQSDLGELKAERDGLLTRVQVIDETSSTIDDLRAERDRLLAELENVQSDLGELKAERDGLLTRVQENHKSEILRLHEFLEDLDKRNESLMRSDLALKEKVAELRYELNTSSGNLFSTDILVY